MAPQWLALLDRGTVGQNVHNDPRMISFMLGQQPELRPHILLVWRGDVLVCVAPFYVQPTRFSFELSVWRMLSVRARALRVFGESVILAAGVDPGSCMTVIGEFLRRESPSIDYLQIYGMNHSDVFWQATLRDSTWCDHTGMASLPMRNEKVHQVIMKDTFDEYVATLSSRTRQNLRRTRRRFFEGGTARIEKFTEQRDVPRFCNG